MNEYNPNIINTQKGVSSKKSGKSFLSELLDIGSYGCGAIHGFHDGADMPFEKENTEMLLTFGPTLVRASLAGCKSGLAGILAGGTAGIGLGAAISENEYSDKKIIRNLSLGALTGSALGGLTLGGGAAGIAGAKGGFQTLVGYITGFMVGKLYK